ncbi:MAG TPA: glycosyltransferase [Anaerolineaceae bacterium]|jgi:glycosyltransferase involved in cell wall biosynthesis|nr:glycosyltransferase [Longilinea sp.]HNZ01653.1 glycosyltransferase [Anaerolineaceae bacterium]HOH20876.1 glycosyltransferase [Anaerolineaceae bacterium]HOU44874.1 glycosyltransferase [Anaerolineaceae bacterium]HPA34310.1 glycosyltransferase [Anaerolineaceae bacterium]
MTTLSIVIPAYNEETGIAEIMNRVLSVREALKSAGVEGFELLVVNDGSRDQTRKVAEEIAQQSPDVRVINHPVNRGYGAALKTGFAQARGDLIGFLDADGTYPPEHFPQLCQAAMAGADLVIGSRMAGAESKMPAVRRIGNWLFATLLSILGWQRVTDSASGMRVFKRSSLEKLYPLPDGLNLTPVMSTRAIHEGLKVVEVPIPYSERVGRSKLSALRDGTIFLQSMVWTVMAYNPVRILGMIGLGGVAVALLVGLGLVIARLSGITTLGPWGVMAVFFGMVSGVTGVGIFAFGATFNYLVSLFYEQPIRQGVFGKPVFKKPLERNFGWMGAIALILGIVIAIISLVIGIGTDDILRMWFYLLGSALLILTGAQMVIYWLLMRVLAELSQRETRAQQDLEIH